MVCVICEIASLCYWKKLKLKLKQVRQLPQLAYIATRPAGCICQRWLTRRSVITGQFLTPGRNCPVRYQHLSLFGLGTNPWAKVHQIGDDLLPTQAYHAAKLYRPASTQAVDIRYKKLRTNKETNSKRYIPSMPICMLG